MLVVMQVGRRAGWLCRRVADGRERSERAAQLGEVVPPSCYGETLKGLGVSPGSGWG